MRVAEKRREKEEGGKGKSDISNINLLNNHSFLFQQQL